MTLLNHFTRPSVNVCCRNGCQLNLMIVVRDSQITLGSMNLIVCIVIVQEHAMLSWGDDPDDD